jgi:hypothetical protein
MSECAFRHVGLGNVRHFVRHAEDSHVDGVRRAFLVGRQLLVDFRQVASVGCLVKLWTRADTAAQA